MYLLDTNVLSEIVKPVPDARVAAKMKTHLDAGLFASEMTRYELRFGASRRADAAAFWERLQRKVVPMVQWLDVTQSIAELGGEIAAALQRAGREAKSPVDPMLAATAIVHGLTLVTRNERDFAHVPGLTVNNWFTAA